MNTDILLKDIIVQSTRKVGEKMVEILEFESGSKVMDNDRKWYLTYGQKGNGFFTITFENLYKQLFLNEEGVVDKAYLEGDNLIIERLKDYDGEVLVPVDKLQSNGTYRFSVKFDAYETLVIIMLSNYMPSIESIYVRELVEHFQSTCHKI